MQTAASFPGWRGPLPLDIHAEGGVRPRVFCILPGGPGSGASAFRALGGILAIALLFCAAIRPDPAEESGPGLHCALAPAATAFAPAALRVPAAPASGALERIRPGERHPGPASRALRTVLRCACVWSAHTYAGTKAARGPLHAVHDSDCPRAAREACGVHAARDDIPLARG